MSYKTPAIGNRLGISMGWTTDVYPLLHTYSATVQNSVKLYFFIKEYFNKKNIMLITYNYSVKFSTQLLLLNIYKYQKLFNLQKKNSTQRKRKIIKKIQSYSKKYRKHTKKRFLYTWKRSGHHTLQTSLGWRIRNLKYWKFKIHKIAEKYKKKSKKKYIFSGKRSKRFVSLKKKKRRSRVKGWTFQIRKNKLLSIHKYNKEKLLFNIQEKNKISTHLCTLATIKSLIKSKSHLFKYSTVRQKNHYKFCLNKLKQMKVKRSIKRIKLHSPDFYNAYLSLLALRFKLRLFLRNKGFSLTNINITEPVKATNKKSIKLYSRSNWYRQIRQQRFFINTIRLLHILEKFPNPSILAEHFARELLNVGKKHWNLIRAFSIILKYWRFHDANFLNKKELERNRERDQKTGKIIKWIPRYKLYSAHDTKKAIRGIKVNIKGKINSTDRTRLKVIQEGIIPIQSFNKNVVYAVAHARVKTGAFGIKVWLFN